MGDPQLVVNDNRDIKEIRPVDGPPVYVGGQWVDNNRKLSAPISKIVAYREEGGMGWEPWFAVYVGDDIALRMNGRFITEIWYEEG